MKSKKIFQGLEEIAGQSFYFVKGLRENGYKVRHVVRKQNPFAFSCDKTLKIDRRKKYLFPLYFLKIAIEEAKDLCCCDIFHFHYGQTFMYNIDLPILKFFNKKVFMEFHGSDLRNPSQAHKLNPYDVETQLELTKRHRKLINSVCKYADGIILHDDELIPYLPKERPPVYVIPLRIDPIMFQTNIPLKGVQRVKIVHAPTNRNLKGSDFIETAIYDLAQKYNIEYVCVENMKQEEAFEIYKSADIIIDQIRIGTYGVFAIEGMALGKPVLTYIMPSMEINFPEELPIVSVNRDSIKQKLEKIIADESLRISLGEQGRMYVEMYHDYRMNTKMLLNLYHGKYKEITGQCAFSEIKKIYEESRGRDV